MENQNKCDLMPEIARLSQWSRAVDEIAHCPIEDLTCSANGLVGFFLDLRKSATPTLPGFADAVRLVNWMTPDEVQGVARYLIRLHRGRFVNVVRGADSTGTAIHILRVEPVGPEIEFTLPARFVRKALEIYKQ